MTNAEMLKIAETENIMEIELCEMADLLEAKDVDGEFEELIGNARFVSGLSETAYDIKEQLMVALDETM